MLLKKVEGNPLFPKWESSRSSRASCVVLVALASLAVLNMVVEEGRGESTEISTTTVVLVTLGSQAVLSANASSTAASCVVLVALAPLAVLEVGHAG